MSTILVIIFVVAYAGIALEEPLKTSKSGVALIGAGLLWTVYALATGDPEQVDENLAESLIETAQIAFFLIGAMTVVEVIDLHDGFEVITARIRARSLATLAWILCGVTFFLSAILDNLTTTIVMVSLLRKLLDKQEDRLLMAGLVVIAANSGGAWSPIGDVTTTMLWIGGQVTSTAIIKAVFLPSVVSLVVPLAAVTWGMRGRMIEHPVTPAYTPEGYTSVFERNLVFCVGLAVLIAVPAFKGITHLPPFMGILFGLGVLWVVADLIHREKETEARREVTLANALTRIDMSAIVFFIGILLAVATLEHAHVLAAMARWLDATVGRLDVIVMIIGLISAIVDNVPMVAAAMGMYSIDQYAPDSFLWEFLAYCAGTGGSILVIGSAAGVAAMSIAKIDFIWYMKRFSLLALIGYVSGALTYIGQYALLH